MQDLKLALVQSDIVWENVPENLKALDRLLDHASGKTDVIVLPEMFNTGFTRNVDKCAEHMGGRTLEWMKLKAGEKDSVVAGSVLTEVDGRYFNRFYWVRPDGSYDTYDKRHLFSRAGEHLTMSAGTQRKIVHHKGWNICLMVCYDLRFPVWSMNRFKDGRYEFDVIIYISNWPEVRREAYLRLLPARAIENQSYVVWVNRTGKDGNGVAHSGDSLTVDPRGDMIVRAEGNREKILETLLPAKKLTEYRASFQLGPDWDIFTIIT